MVKQFKFSFNASDGQKIAAFKYVGEETKAIICLLHGFGEHQGRFQHLYEKFTQSSFLVYSYDQRGHGKTKGKKGHFNPYSKVTSDLNKMINHISQEHPSLPIVLYCHSFGGNVGLNYLLTRKRENIHCAVITSPWLKLTISPPKTKVLLAKLASSIYPAYSDSSGLDTNELSSVSEEVEKYNNDPLVHDKITASAFFGIVQSGKWSLENANNLTVPTLIVHGTGDQVTSHLASKEFCLKSKKFASLKLWEGLKHETHNEYNKKAVIQYNLDWIEANF